MEKQPLRVYNYAMDFSRPDNARAINRLKVLSELRTGECSRAELSRRLGINKVSIGDMIQDMIAEGLVTEGKKDTSQAGRPGTLISINKSAGRVFAFDIRTRSISISVSDTVGNVLRFERFPKNDETAANIKKAIERMRSGENVKIFGSAVITTDADFDTSYFPRPLITIPRAIAEASAEIYKTKNMEGFLFLSWSESFDAALQREELMHIPTLAHIKAQKDGACYCGGKGCLEVAASGRTLMERTGAPSIRDLVRNPSYAASIKEALRPIAMALSEAVQATAASDVMITGDLSALPDSAYAYLQNLVTALLPPDRGVTVYRSLSGENGTREGAAIAALDLFFYRTQLLKKLEMIQRIENAL